MYSYRNAYNRERVDALVARSRDSSSIRVMEICVEGKDDVDFYERWITSIKSLISSKTVIRVKEIKNIVGSYPNIDEAVGNCDLVVQIAQVDKDKNRLFIRDRDLLEDKDLVCANNLFYTDYPAIESYPFTEESFNLFNKAVYSGDYKDIDIRYKYSLHFLFSMYFLRLSNKGNKGTVKLEIDQLRKKYGSYFKDGYFRIEDFYQHNDPDIKNSVDDVLNKLNKKEIDARKYIYSHDTEDILNFLFAMDKDFLKSMKAPPFKGRHIIDWMLKKFIDDRLWEQELMFQGIINRYILSEN
ncbi:hypothetical protein HMPREF2625_08935 [Rothia sp. HMSC064D08]|uniref:hypothetical protein n=1 Tax=Rothia sp. HMSC064D08 TaxID=1715104 RepID=UPI0008A113D3|nr:hypothetical protein [Rothia sp. HMSC064D08]OFN04310.1 hypothetical protein HMPREF2625_08935 [Rothia sp. HMSC064D08]